ncbi:hypothetical protein MHSWG343_10790 [Candidatus Mycoplasma haematohominis]|uniref:Uncharacterized protein n=1 Tax=Candidatus Mycoplasma haematohominis TaxID=1494318 RepID=A0A478FR73_9MOLU|nr:hypothetical protein MHSWG343_10790 [Candidatus Mycoplasma haemohominis]
MESIKSLINQLIRGGVEDGNRSEKLQQTFTEEMELKNHK